MPPLYLITPLGVYQKTFAMMICNGYTVDDIQNFVLMIYTTLPCFFILVWGGVREHRALFYFLFLRYSRGAIPQ